MSQLLKSLPPEFWQALAALVVTLISTALAALFDAMRKRLRGATELAILARVETAVRTAVASVEQRYAGPLRETDGTLPKSDAVDVFKLAVLQVREELGPRNLAALDKITDPSTGVESILQAKIEAAVLEQKRSLPPPPYSQRGSASIAAMLIACCVALLFASACMLGCAARPVAVPVPPPSEPSYQECMRAVKRASHAEANELCPPAKVKWLECEHRAAIVAALEQEQAACREGE